MSCDFSVSILREPSEGGIFSIQERELGSKVIVSPSSLSHTDPSLLGRVSKLKGIINKDNNPPPMMEKVNGGGEIKISASWGGDEDTEVHIGASGNIRDESGNYVKVDASQEVSDGKLGKGSANVAAGHEEK